MFHNEISAGFAQWPGANYGCAGSKCKSPIKDHSACYRRIIARDLPELTRGRAGNRRAQLLMVGYVVSVHADIQRGALLNPEGAKRTYVEVLDGLRAAGAAPIDLVREDT